MQAPSRGGQAKLERQITQYKEKNKLKRPQ